MKAKLLPAILLCVVLAACDRSPVAPANPPPSDTPYAQVPNPKDVVIYQVNIRAFSPAGNFAGVQARLDSIKALGVNVLYLLPVYPVGVLKGVNSPYCIKDYTAVNNEFGTLEDLRTLVAEAHKRNMAVLFDWVADHTSWDNAWINNKSWYRQDAAGNIISPPNTGWKDVATLNFDNPDMRKAMIEAMKYWVTEANIDGYRCDAADFVPSDFWEQAIDSLRAIPGHQLLLLAEGTRPDLFTAGFQLKYGMDYYDNLARNIFLKKGSVRSLDALNKKESADATADDRVVRYTSNHDVDQDATPLDALGGKNGSLAAFVVTAYMQGAPMIYDGQEVGCPVKLSFMNKSTIIDWTANPEMTGDYKKLIGFRNSSEAIRQGDLHTFSSDDVCVFTKTFKTEEVLVIANLRNADATFSPPSTVVRTGWKDVFDGTDATLPDQLQLKAFQYQVLKRKVSGLFAPFTHYNTAPVTNNAAPAVPVAAPPADNRPRVSLSVPGSYEGWNPAAAPMISGVGGVFEGYVNMPGSGPQSFKYANAADQITYTDGGNGTLSADGKGAALTVPDGGYYELTADLTKKRWSATKTTWSIIGNATPGGWDNDTKMNYDPVKQVWTVDVAMTAAGSFKFRANNAWTIDFGIDDGGNLQYADNPLLPYNSTLKDLTVPADGKYTVMLDLHVPGKYTYSLIRN